MKCEVRNLYSLMLKTQKNWRPDRISGDVNKLNIDCLFETENEYGFPEVESNLEPKDLLSFIYANRIPTKAEKEKAVHFFLDDYKFEKLWTRPKTFINTFKQYAGIVSPTFSVWSNQPYALNVFNMYRSRWITRYYQEFGIPVLVDVRWADESSYDYCFSGIKKHSPVIVNTVGTKRNDNRKIFVDGFYEMMRVIEPSKLFVYGEVMPVDFDKYFDDVVYFESFWKQQRDKIALKKGVAKNGKW